MYFNNMHTTYKIEIDKAEQFKAYVLDGNKFVTYSSYIEQFDYENYIVFNLEFSNIKAINKPIKQFIKACKLL